MIPAWPDENAPQGERDVFGMLAGGPPAWTVLHSLDLAPWNGSRRTELDFVVIMPDAGILCIEVKSHAEISFDGARWHPDSIRRSPLKQAMDGRFALHRRLEALAPWTRAVPVVHTCIFPNARFDVDSTLSIRSWEVMDVRTFRNCKTSTEFASELERRSRQGIADESLALERAISPRRVAELVALCVPIQKRRQGAREESLRRRAELERALLAQQRPALKLWSGNARVLITGPAGTGKTLIAMELALRCAEEGSRVALVSFNRAVGNWMAEQAKRSNAPPALVVGSAYRLLLQIFSIQPPAVPNELYWETELPNQVLERLTDPEAASALTFDALVVDEAQDILARPALWDCLLALVSGGLRNGRFALFGDTEGQNLAIGGHLSVSLAALDRVTPARWSLDDNCRNFRTVGDAALSLSGYPRDLYSSYLRRGEAHTDVDYVLCVDGEDELRLVRGCISGLRAQGYSDAQITLLSFCAPSGSIGRRLVAESYRIRLAADGGNCLTYDSVHGFKGLENEVVLVTDIDLSMGSLSRSLFYTALTRSTGIVKVFCRERDARQLLEWAGVRTS